MNTFALSTKKTPAPIGLLWLGMALAMVLAHWSVNQWVLTDPLYYASWENRMSEARMEELLSRLRSLEWIAYFTKVAWQAVRIMAVSSLLMLGAYFYRYKLSFSQAIWCALGAEIALIAAIFAKTLWFPYFADAYTVADVNQHELLSLASLFEAQSIPLWLSSALSKISFFEGLYIILLAQRMGKVVDAPFTESLSAVSSGYGLGLVAWISLSIGMQLFTAS